MHRFYDAIYLSPHLDDAALSCGGQIALRASHGERVLIVTIMAGDLEEHEGAAPAMSDFARLLHERWELTAGTVAARRAEDRAACAALGAEWLHLDVLDCIYRSGPAGEALYASEAALFGAVAPAELEHFVPQLADKLAALPRAGVVIGPLAVGNHVDHQLVRAAAERAFGADLYFYEDYPYMRIPGARDRVISPDAIDWRARVIPLTAGALEAKISAISAFTSQIGIFFADQADLERQIEAFAAETGGEQIWWRETAV